MHHFVIIADDFTGANDTGVQLCKRGIPADVILDIDQIEDNENSLAIDSESRVVSGEDAYNRIYEAVSCVEQRGGCQFLYKKVDSTLRGHLQEEIRAAVDVYKPELIVFAPAYPAQGRTVQQGRLCVHGVPLLDTEIARDPRNPLQEDHVQKILSDCLGQPVHHYELGSDIDRDFDLTGTAYSFDTKKQSQLEHIARAAINTGKKILWIGSAGLAQGILTACWRRKPTLAVIGSISSKAMDQMKYCSDKGLTVVSLDMKAIYENREMESAVRDVVTFLKGGQDVVLTAASCRQDYENFAAYGRNHGISTDELAEFTKQTLSRMVPMILREADVNGLFLTGGDTAIAIICQLEASGSHIERELVPGFVLGRLLGGAHAGLPIVTKAGAFGAEADVYNCIKELDDLPSQ
ncbi:four-carbon acid sugar kinase family protein [Megasphaera massiliensis]|uniref:four-carbon acid sugar kinase family protein n=1 Tax=Megasphaera massiliensis TaxID=1232428 RepID=UPI00399BC6BE